MDLDQYIELHKDWDYVVLAKTPVGDAEVSTVWLGMDYNFTGEGPPIIFETMIFGGELNEYCWRYETECQAFAGHAKIVHMLREGSMSNEHD